MPTDDLDDSMNIVDIVVDNEEDSDEEHATSPAIASSSTSTSTNPQFPQDSSIMCIPRSLQHQHFAHNSGLAVMDPGRSFGGNQQLIYPHMPHPHQMVPQQHSVDPGSQIVPTPVHSGLRANCFTLPVHQIMQQSQAPIQMVGRIATNQPYLPFQNSTTMAQFNQNSAPTQQQSFRNAVSSQRLLNHNAVFNQQQTYQHFAPSLQQSYQNIAPNQQPYQNHPITYQQFQNNTFAPTIQLQSSSTGIVYQSSDNGQPQQLYHHMTNQTMPAAMYNNETQSSNLAAFTVTGPNQSNQNMLAVMQPNMDHASSRPIKTEETDRQQSEPTSAGSWQTSNASSINSSVSFGGPSTIDLTTDPDEAVESSKSLRRRKRPLDQPLVQQNRPPSTLRSLLQLPRASHEVLPPSTRVPARRQRRTSSPDQVNQKSTHDNTKL